MTTPRINEHSESQQALSHFLSENRDSLGRAFLQTAMLSPRFNERISRLGDDLKNFIEEEVVFNVDYIQHWIGESDDNFSALYIGEKAKMAFEPGATADERNKNIIRFIESDKKILLDAAKNALHPKVLQLITDTYASLVEPLQKPTKKELKILFIGDCLFLDIIGFLTGQTARQGISIVPEFITHKNPTKIMIDLKQFSNDDFDLIFYSPFTYEFNSDFNTFFNWKNCWFGQNTINNLVEKIFSDIEPVINKLSQHFSSSIFVHNTAAIIRAENNSKHAIKSTLTKRVRKKASIAVDKKLNSVLFNANNSSFFHLYKFDENVFHKTIPDKVLGAYFYHSFLQHPAKLGALISQHYSLISNTTANLFGKKIIVCDLDNTLWDGVIGEGAVQHHTEKQALLKRIKAKGVVLAIASKNDPANVHWDGGILDDDDFVYSHINWEPKIGAFKKMSAELNLKLKDFVFIDDRSDEREFVNSAYPEITTLDALADDSWEMIALWESMLDENTSMDRTQLYQERAERNQFIQHPGDDLNEAEMFDSLGLQISITHVDESNIQRATELINRTNQFNMCASRTSLTEMTARMQSADYTILATSMADKFGDMGVISILVAKETDSAIEILDFVLSCRVFGYAAETVILNRVKDIAMKAKKPITGKYIETMYNSPCKNTYQKNGFIHHATHWQFDTFDKSTTQPTWFTIVS
jgi:FkbH-like protein